MEISRRAVLLLGLAGLAACSRGRVREKWESGPRLRTGHPILRIPFAAGTVVMCQQGNLMPEGHTHFKPNNRFALDLSNATIGPLDVIAAAPGRVAYVYAGSAAGDTQAGLGFGNHVKVEHGDGYFTMYAHLEEVVVKEGDLLECGGRIGTVGFTGAAGNRHLHFSLHQDKPGGMGVYESIAMDALVTTEAGEGMSFRRMSSMDLRDGRPYIWGGSLYGSENDGAGPLISGAPPAALAARLQAGGAALQQAMRDRTDLDRIANEWEQSDAAWARAILAPILSRAPRHAVARYWFATAVDSAEKRWEEATATFMDLLAGGAAEPTWEAWLPSWIYNRLGVFSLNAGRVDVARSRFKEAARRATAKPERDFAIEKLIAL